MSHFKNLRSLDFSGKKLHNINYFYIKKPKNSVSNSITSFVQTDDNLLSSVSNNFQNEFIKKSLKNKISLSEDENSSINNNIKSFLSNRISSKKIKLSPSIKINKFNEFFPSLSKSNIKPSKLRKPSFSFKTISNQKIKLESFSKIKKRMKIKFNPMLKDISSIFQNDDSENKTIDSIYDKEKEKKKTLIINGLLNKNPRNLKQRYTKYTTINQNKKKILPSKYETLIPKLSIPFVIKDNNLINEYYKENENYRKKLIKYHFIKNNFIDND